MVPTKSKSDTDRSLVPQIGSAYELKVRHQVGAKPLHSFVGTMVPTKSKSDTDRPLVPQIGSAYESKVRHQVGAKPLHSFVGTMVPTKSKSVNDRPWSLRSDLPTSQRSDTRSGRSRSTVLSAPWCRQNQSRSLTDQAHVAKDGLSARSDHAQRARNNCAPFAPTYHGTCPSCPHVQCQDDADGQAQRRRLHSRRNRRNLTFQWTMSFAQDRRVWSIHRVNCIRAQ
jgi:hypothetical protein